MKNAVILFSKLILPLFYSREYLQGKWFENNIKGWKWAWKSLFMQKIIGYNKHVPWPVSHRNNIGDPNKIFFHIDDLNNFQNFGCYYQCYDSTIFLGKGTWIAPNVGLITQNHDFSDLSKHSIGKAIVIGENCWIGMNSVILPGVELGEGTIVGAGSIVTKSFTEGKVIIAGNPAKVIKKL